MARRFADDVARVDSRLGRGSVSIIRFRVLLKYTGGYLRRPRQYEASAHRWCAGLGQSQRINTISSSSWLHYNLRPGTISNKTILNVHITVNALATRLVIV